MEKKHSIPKYKMCTMINRNFGYIYQKPF